MEPVGLQVRSLRVWDKCLMASVLALFCLLGGRGPVSGREVEGHGAREEQGVFGDPLTTRLELVADSFHGQSRETLELQFISLEHCSCRPRIRLALSKSQRQKACTVSKQEPDEDEDIILPLLIETRGLAPNSVLRDQYYVRLSGSLCSRKPRSETSSVSLQKATTSHSCDRACTGLLHEQKEGEGRRSQKSSPLLRLCQLYNRLRWETCLKSLVAAVDSITKQLFHLSSHPPLAASPSATVIRTARMAHLTVTWVHGTHATLLLGGSGAGTKPQLARVSLSVRQNELLFCREHNLAPDSCRILQFHLEAARKRVAKWEALQLKKSHPEAKQEAGTLGEDPKMVNGSKKALRSSRERCRKLEGGAGSPISWCEYQNVCLSYSSPPSAELLFILDTDDLQRTDDRLFFASLDDSAFEKALVNDVMGSSNAFPQGMPEQQDALELFADDEKRERVKRAPVQNVFLRPEGSSISSRLVFLPEKERGSIKFEGGHTLLAQVKPHTELTIYHLAQKLMAAYASLLNAERLLESRENLLANVLMFLPSTVTDERQRIRMTRWAQGLAQALLGNETSFSILSQALERGEKQELRCFRHLTIAGTASYLVPSPETALSFSRYISRQLGFVHGYELILIASRKSQPTRRLLNEEAVKRAVEQSCGGRWKVELVELSLLHFKDQVALLSRTAVLLSVYGSDLTNLIFLPPGAVVIELSEPQLPSKLFEGVAAASGIPYFQYLAKTEEGEVVYQDEGWRKGAYVQHSMSACLSSASCSKGKSLYDIALNLPRFTKFMQWPLRSALASRPHMIS